MSLNRWDCILCIGIIALPFIDSFGVIGFFAPLRTLSFSVLLLSSLLWLAVKFLKGEKIKLLPRREMIWLMLFLVVILVSGMINFPEIIVAKYQGNAGFNRYFLSLGLLIINIVVMFFVYNVLIDGCDKLNRINYCILVSFCISAIYGMVEVLSILQQPLAVEIQKMIDAAFRGNNDYIVGVRVRGLAKEPSNFGIYVSIIIPWIINYYYKEKSMIRNAISLVMLVVLLLLTVLSVSRTTYIIMIVEIVVFLILLKNVFLDNMRKNWMLIIIGTVSVLSLLSCIPEDVMYVDFFSTVESIANYQGSMSNIARYSSQVAALYVFIDNPLVGVGYDQFAIHAPSYYPSWGYISNEVVDWATNYTKGDTWPPAYNFFCRLLAETGLLGTATFLGFLLSLLKKSNESIKLKESSNESYRLFRCLQISVIGVTFSGINGSEISSIMWLFYAILIGETVRYAKKEG